MHSTDTGRAGLRARLAGPHHRLGGPVRVVVAARSGGGGSMDPDW